MQAGTAYPEATVEHLIFNGGYEIYFYSLP